jgi:hypothetical protein
LGAQKIFFFGMRRCRRMGKNDEEKRNKLRNGMRIELEK